LNSPPALAHLRMSEFLSGSSSFAGDMIVVLKSRVVVCVVARRRKRRASVS
jgi:hypothetical protein